MKGFKKRKFPLIFGLVIGLVLPAFLFPLYHFHPENTHTHPGQLQAHEHQAHFHSEVLEAYAHLFVHPSDPDQDKRFHQTHSSPDHDKDDVDFYKFQKNVPPIKSIFVVKHVDSPVYFEAPIPLFSCRVWFEIPTFKSLEFPGTHSSRSPPFYLI
ncbi:hypothetical protein UR09_05185 [Candidatus Nitromaritima sp. SCGC AAA799-A02]|nr:hypothetical protein UR09_05185 [Candidatus Nitromaritima sp. SCGC AAA799-A02]KMP11159.1 hypothetical protein UZ36_05320 [Candidatus Nitromaritima sp. SCGC AAA799-C22]